MKSLRFGAALLLWAAMASAQSLYDERSFRALAADNKASRVGDVLTVQVLENASASANADTGLHRANDIGAGLTRAHVPAIRLAAGSNSEFAGGGRTERGGKVLAQLSVSVRELLANGELRVAGEQVLLINEEQQRIQVEGRVRAQDISDANVVLSSRLADARITYVGDGTLAKRQKPGWWRSLLDWFGI